MIKTNIDKPKERDRNNMKPGDVIRIPKGSKRAFNTKSDVGIVISTRTRGDSWPDDFNIMVDSIVHAMGFQIEKDIEIICES